MQLAEYLAVNRIRLHDFAEKIGMSAPSVSKLANGVNKPSFDTMQKIAEVTGGLVSADDFLHQHNGNAA